MVKGVLVSFSTVKDLDKILSAPGPCLTIYTEAGAPDAALRWRESVSAISSDLVPEWSEIQAELVDEDINGKSVAIFRSDDIFQLAILNSKVADRAVLGPHFFVRPLLKQIAEDQSFYILALSQKNTRLLHCTPQAAEEVPFSADIKSDFDVWMNQVKPDHTAVNNAVTGGRQSSGIPNALAPKGSDQDSKSEYLSHYFKQINHGVNELLRGRTEPLVICGVEYEIPLYEQVNSYPHLCREVVRGAANSLKSGELHARAIEALDRAYESNVDDQLAIWNHKVGAGASNHLKDVVTAAHEGRILTLIISDSQEQMGTFDEQTYKVKGRLNGTSEDEDLVNDAAVQTIRKGGNVFIAPHHKMPNGSPLAAIFRY